MIFLSSKEAAQKLGKSYGTLANWRTRGIGPVWIKFGWGVLYPINEIEKYMKDKAK